MERKAERSQAFLSGIRGLDAKGRGGRMAEGKGCLMMSDEEREYKKITEEELFRVLEEHEKWLKWEETDEKERPEGM